jgi:hypothetical protein
MMAPVDLGAMRWNSGRGAGSGTVSASAGAAIREASEATRANDPPLALYRPAIAVSVLHAPVRW